MATTVYALNKYPGNELKEHRKILATKIPVRTKLKTHYEFGLNSRMKNCKVENTTDVYNEMQKQNRISVLGNERDGLGPIPRTVDTLTSCILFNSHEKPYKTYNTSYDTLNNKINRGTKKSGNNEKTKQMHEAPFTIVNDIGLPFLASGSYNF
eukprot:UN26422